jgi:hypothetical protein
MLSLAEWVKAQSAPPPADERAAIPGMRSFELRFWENFGFIPV